MMQNIAGKDVVAKIGDVVIFCGKDCIFSEEKEIIEASTVTSGEWKEFRLRKRSWNLQVSGLTKINNLDGQESFFDILSLSGLQSVSASYTDADGGFVIISGSAYITDSGITGPSDQFAEPSVQFIGEGAYSVIL